ncbi:ESX secretion-associated protein EspG [Saccharopolyspora rosea]|uniref:ESX secretion-associated protein EspG n=1 Tax=Saccharopolyspora rosea TaxID=524884 RepID=A0ABW3FW60_9PSEU|nr:ESX secretion-associated protein EspG [Saccharopolyspora rosea]
MECSFWEFGAIVRQERARHEAGLVSAVEARRKFDVPVFVASRASGLPRPDDPRATLAEAEASVRAKGWIERSGRLDDSWYEIVSTLVYGPSLAYLYLNAPDSAETRALVAASRGLAFRIVLRGERVRIDEVRPDAAERALVACLPDVAPAPGRAVEVPTGVLRAAGIEAENHRADQGDWIAYELGQADVPASDAREIGRFCKLADRTTAHFNVAVRDTRGAGHLAPWAITVHHSPAGRVAQIPQPPGGERTVVGPGSAKVIAVALCEYRDRMHLQLGEDRLSSRL